MYNDNTPAALGYRVMHLPSLSLLLPVDVADFVDDKAVGDAVAFVEASRKKEKEADSSDKNKVQFKDGKETELKKVNDEDVSEGENDRVEIKMTDDDDDDQLKKLCSTGPAPGMQLLEYSVQKMVNFSNKIEESSDVESVKEPPRYRVFTYKQARDLDKRIRTISDSDSKEVLTRYRKNMEKEGGYRPVGMPTIESLAWLEDEHPNFSEPIAFVRNRLILSQLTGLALRIPPMLLSGDPGVGKTHFSKSLARAFGTPIHRMSYDGPIAASALIGMDRQWSNSRAGELFSAVVLGTHANPVFLLDELDKARGSKHDDPVAPFHTLWEPGTSGAVKDLSTEVEFDASLVTWIATANNPLLIPPTLRTRLREFWIAMPSPADAIKITHFVAANVVESSAPPGFSLIKPRMVVLLAHLTPREVIKAVGDAVAAAVANGRMEVVRGDFPAEVFAEETSTDSVSFLH